MMTPELREWFRNLSVVTNSIQNALILAGNPGIIIILIGGILDRDGYTLVNGFSSTLESIHINIMFMAITGISPAIRYMDQRLSKIRVQNQIHRRVSRTIVLADSSRFDKTSLLKICPFGEVDAIVTDSGISLELESRIREAGANLIITRRKIRYHEYIRYFGACHGRPIQFPHGGGYQDRKDCVGTFEGASGKSRYSSPRSPYQDIQGP